MLVFLPNFTMCNATRIHSCVFVGNWFIVQIVRWLCAMQFEVSNWTYD